MDVRCVVDDAVQRSSPYWGEHGLAFLVDSEGGRVLFDAGQSGTVLLHNLDAMDVPPESIDAVALSHGHCDHTDGLFSLVDQLKPGTPLYAHPDLFRERCSVRDGVMERVGVGSYSRKERGTDSWGADENRIDVGNGGAEAGRAALAERMSLRLSAEGQEIVPGIWTTGEIKDRPELEGRSDRHYMTRGGELVSDRYVDDMALVMSLKSGLLLLCGCCHAGLLNTLAHVEERFEGSVEVIAGGLHLTGLSPDDLKHVRQALKERPALRRVYAGHCTGETAFVALINTLGSWVVRPCPVGTVLELSED